MELINKKLEYQRQYRINNKDKVLEAKKKYRDNNKEKISEYKQIYRDNNKSAIYEYNQQYNELNKGRLQENRILNKDKLQEYKSEVCSCNCGKTYTRNHKAQHEKSKYHQSHIITSTS